MSTSQEGHPYVYVDLTEFSCTPILMNTTETVRTVSLLFCIAGDPKLAVEGLVAVANALMIQQGTVRFLFLEGKCKRGAGRYCYYDI